MKKIAQEELVVGSLALLKVGSPVRQWMRKFRGGPEAWLTPLRYVPAAEDPWQPSDAPRYVEVEIVKVMLPYVIVYHHSLLGTVQLWIDTRRAGLFATEE